LLVRVQVRPSTNSSVKTHGLILCAINPRGKFSRVNPRANGYPIYGLWPFAEAVNVRSEDFGAIACGSLYRAGERRRSLIQIR
jgi:hypothetical protein